MINPNEVNEYAKKKVSIIIPVYRDWSRAQLCLDSLYQQSYPQELLEILLVNNEQTAENSKLLKIQSNTLIFHQIQPGSYAARNLALEQASGEIIAFTDSDCIAHKDWIKNSVAQIIRGAQRVAGHVELFYKDPKNLTLAELYEKAFAFSQVSKIKRTGGSVTANLVTTREVFDLVGPFNDQLFSGGDIAWGKKATDAGVGIVFGEDCVIYHPARSDLSELFQKKRRTTGGAFKSGKTKSLSWILRGFHPPIKDMLRCFRSKKLTLMEKIKVCTLRYLLKLYRTWIGIKLNRGTEKMIRQ